MKKIALISLIASSMLMAGGYKIPETSLNGVALSAANIAHNKNADAAYYNPANMVFMADENVIEADLTYISLDAPNYNGSIALNGTALGSHNIDGESETFLVPSINYVSNKINGARFGLSVSVPGGLSKRWEGSVASYSAEEFTLEVVEVNPTIALPVGNDMGIALGFRIVHSKGIVKSTSPMASRDMTGDSMDYGFNFAFAYNPSPEWELGLTYRSKVDLSEAGDAKLSYYDAANSFGPLTGATAATLYSSDSAAYVSVPLPAALSLAMAYTFDSTTVEFVFERNYWSAYEDLDFDYGSGVNTVTNMVFGTKIEKDWDDTNVYRLGVTHEMDEMTLMAGIVIDETPVPSATLGFELPDSDSTSLSLGGRYQVNEKLNLGLSALYSMRDDRSLVNDDLNGKFTDANVLLVSVGAGYKF